MRETRACFDSDDSDDLNSNSRNFILTVSKQFDRPLTKLSPDSDHYRVSRHPNIVSPVNR